MFSVRQPRGDNSLDSANRRIQVVVAKDEVGWGTATSTDRRPDGLLIADIVLSHTWVVLANDVLQFTLCLTCVTRHLDVCIPDNARVGQLVSCRSRRHRIILAESFLFDRELQRLVLVNLPLLDALGDSVSNLLTGVVARAWLIVIESVHLVFTHRRLERRRACYFENAIELGAHGVLRLVLAGSQAAIKIFVVEPLDRAAKQLHTARP